MISWMSIQSVSYDSQFRKEIASPRGQSSTKKKKPQLVDTPIFQFVIHCAQQREADYFSVNNLSFPTKSVASSLGKNPIPIPPHYCFDFCSASAFAINSLETRTVRLPSHPTIQSPRREKNT